ncbi:MAG: hypothetical protein JWO06_197, partial [Bacteroidota bacterium]|nr:hypothetical protein [Bacteroidota bacterium]
IAATGFWSHDGSTIYAQSLIFPDYDNWIIQFNGNCGNNAFTSLTELENTGLRIFPNPAEGILNIEPTVVLNNASLSIINALGETVKSISSINGSSFGLVTNELKNGIYFLRLQDGEQGYSATFIKE